MVKWRHLRQAFIKLHYMETIKQVGVKALIMALALFSFIDADAKVIPNPIFADNMVLQQNAQVAFWGEAKA